MTKKTLSQIKKALAEQLEGKLKLEESFNDEIGPREIELLTAYLKQLTSAYQKDITTVLQRTETELNKYGYTFGPLDLTGIEEADGEEEDFFIFPYANQEEPVKNAFITLTWETLSSGQQFDWRPDGSALQIRIIASLNVIDREDFEELFADADLSPTDEDDVVDYSGDSEVIANDPSRVE